MPRDPFPPQPPSMHAPRPLREVRRFHIRTSTPDQTTDNIIANGYMQIPVDISIQVTDTSTGRILKLSEEELSLIKVVRFEGSNSSKHADITKFWAFSKIENEFAHSVGQVSTAVASPPAGMNGSYSYLKIDNIRDFQWIRYWVTTTKVESVRLGAVITLPPISAGTGQLVSKSEQYSTFDQDFDTHVIITSQAGKVYRKKDLTITQEQTASLSLDIVSASPQKVGDLLGLTMKNSYITLPVPIVFANIFMPEIRPRGTEKQEFLEYCFGFDMVTKHPSKGDAATTPGSIFTFYHVWDTGEEAERPVGFGKQELRSLWNATDRYLDLDDSSDSLLRSYRMTYNSCPESLCLTTLAIYAEKPCLKRLPEGGFTPLNRSVVGTCEVRLFDPVGNYGTFRISAPESEGIRVVDFDCPRDGVGVVGLARQNLGEKIVGFDLNANAK